MKDLFDIINIDEILSIMKETRSYQKYNCKPDHYYKKKPYNTIPDYVNISSKTLTTKL